MFGAFVFEMSKKDINIKFALKDMEGNVMEPVLPEVVKEQELSSQPLRRPTLKRRISDVNGLASSPTPLRNLGRHGSDAMSKHQQRLSQINDVANSCMAWSLLHIFPDLGEVEAFMRLASTAGPHSYQDYAEVVKDYYQFEVKTGHFSGFCLVLGALCSFV